MFSRHTKPHASGGASRSLRGGERRTPFHGGGHRGNDRGQRHSRRKIATFDPSQFINKNPVRTSETLYEPQYRFDSFGLPDGLVATIHKLGITVPTPIQDQAIPVIREGKDVIGLAETGTGKTAAFLVPLIEQSIRDHSRRVLIMAPTRELAIQINDEFKKLSAGYRLFSTICVGGTSIRPQIMSLKRTNHFIVGTPGRLLDLLDRHSIDGSRITSVVLDEADRMLDMGFIHDMRRILEQVPKERLTLLFSATMTKDAEALVNDFMQNPVTISVKKKETAEAIEQDIVKYSEHTKFDTLTALLRDPAFSRVIIFGAMKHSVEKLGKELQKNGIHAESIHGNKNHAQRQRALGAFKAGRVQVLVATDVAARGIHVDDVSHVINYDLPGTFEDYVHRIGRTGRGTKRGKALTFVSEHVIESAQKAPARQHVSSRSSTHRGYGGHSERRVGRQGGAHRTTSFQGGNSRGNRPKLEKIRF